MNMRRWCLGQGVTQLLIREIREEEAESQERSEKVRMFIRMFKRYSIYFLYTLKTCYSCAHWDARLLLREEFRAWCQCLQSSKETKKDVSPL